jgi:tRNA/tmRNA/rRNA uracil-C5-methylase (TrmA/RlmC/RlmD family)
LYNQAKGSKASCVELYGGVDTIGLNIADLVSSLTSSDENPFNKECFEKSAGDAGLNNVTYDAKNATDMMQSLSHGTLTLKGKNGNSHIAGCEKIIQAPQVDLLGNCLSTGRR